MHGTGGVRAVFFFSALLVLASACLAANATARPSAAEQFGYQVVPQGTGFYVENLSCNGTDEYAIVSGGEPQAFLAADGAARAGKGANGAGAAANASSAPVQPITDAARLAASIRCHYIAKQHDEDLLPVFSAVHKEADRLRTMHIRGEAGCRILLGTDRTACVSFETCQRACYSVTSFCQPVALGAGRNFVNTMWMFENDSRALEAAYDAENASYAAFAEDMSQERALAYLDAVGNAGADAERAAGSQLFYEYSFCFSPDYPAYELYLLKGRAQRQYANASVFYGIPALAGRIANSTIAAIEKSARYSTARWEDKAGDGSGADGAQGGVARNETETQDGQAAPKNPLVDFFSRILSFFLGRVQ
jgi:hypothetical protein